MSTIVNTELDIEAHVVCRQGRDLPSANIQDLWLCDSRATKHICFRREWFDKLTPGNGEQIFLGDNSVKEVVGVGSIRIKRLVNGTWINGQLDDVMYVPDFKKNLFSINACTRKGIRATYEDDRVILQLKSTNGIVAEGVKYHSDICCLLFKVEQSEVHYGEVSLQNIHESLGHVNKATLRKMIKSKAIDGIEGVRDKEFFCEGCVFGKMHRQPCKDSNEEEHIYNPGECIHADLCGPMSISLGNNKYFMLLKDRCTGYRWVYFLKYKNDALQSFKVFCNEVETTTGHKIKVLRTDGGLEFCNSDFKSMLGSRGIRLCTSAPHRPEQNGRIERENRTVIESARSMLHARDVPRCLWAEAVSTAVYALNRTVSSNSKNFKSPYELWYYRKPNVSHMRPFGIEAYVFIPDKFRKKFDPKARKAIFVGYHGDSENYRLYDPPRRRIHVSKDVKFNCSVNDENDIAIKINNSRNAQADKFQEEANISNMQHDAEINVLGNEADENKSSEAMDISENDNNLGEENEVRHSEILSTPIKIGAARKAKKRKAAEPIIHTPKLRDRTTIKRPRRYDANLAEVYEPVDFHDAVNCQNSEEWKIAINEELASHDKNATWEIVQCPQDKQLLDTKWVFKVKTDAAGNVSKYKARLCARGFLQRPGIDYEDTFAHVVRYESLRILLAIAAQEDLDIVQFDIKTAFLYGMLQEEIYIKVSEGLYISDSEVKACRLRKSLYGLKQAPKCWNEKFNSFLCKFGFVRCEYEWSIYICKTSVKPMYLALFVDDGLIFGKCMSDIEHVLNALESEFEITVGDANVFVGIEIERDRNAKSIFLHQESYARKILNRFNMSLAYPCNTPEIQKFHCAHQLKIVI